MKILKLRGDFKKVADKNWADVVKINGMVDLGWKFASKKEYKEVYGSKKDVVKSDTVVVAEKAPKKVVEKKGKKKK